MDIRERRREELNDAIISGDVEAVMQILSEKNVDLNVPNEYGYTFLHLAVMTNNEYIVKLLLSAGADPNPPCKVFDYSNIKHANKTQGPMVTKFLKPIPVVVDTPLHIALKSENSAEIVRLLIIYGANLNTRRPDNGETPLHSMAVCKDEKLVFYIATECLIRRENVDISDSNGNTPLAHAVKNGNKAAVKVLLNCGADTQYENKNGETPEVLAKNLATTAARKEINELIQLKKAKLKQNITEAITALSSFLLKAQTPSFVKQ